LFRLSASACAAVTANAAAAVLQIDASSFKPILLAPALEDIDKIVARDSGIKKSIDKYRYVCLMLQQLHQPQLFY
jgi:hypothetical protein